MIWLKYIAEGLLRCGPIGRDTVREFERQQSEIFQRQTSLFTPQRHHQPQPKSYRGVNHA